MYGLELGRSVQRTGAGAYRGGIPPTACLSLLLFVLCVATMLMLMVK